MYIHVTIAPSTAAEILIALAYLHNLNILHRDVKPENILLGADMHILVTDFGTAKILEPEPEDATDTGEGDEGGAPPKRPRASSFVGTAEYLSPELMNSKSASRASDVWAAGCVLFQVLSGKPPFRSFNDYQVS